MNTRFYNARILTMKDRNITEGELWTEGDKISYIGPSREDKPSFDREIDCSGNLLMPGFKNAHAHTGMTFARSLADDVTFDKWLFEHIFPVEHKLNGDNIYWLSMLGFAEYIASGVTACFDMYIHVDDQARSATDAGFRNVFCGGVNDYGGMDTLEEEFHKYNSYNDLISYRLGIHAEYTTSEKILNTVADIVHKYKAPCYSHISETREEVEGCISRYGMSPVKLLDKLGMYDYGGGGFHCVWFDDEDMKIFKDRDLYAVFNNCSNLKLASGAPRVDKFVNDGIKIAIGTDGPGSNNSLNMFKEMYLASTLSNLFVEGGAFIDPYEILKAATVGSAGCMGLTDCDVLDTGKKADIIMIDMRHPTMQPDNNTINNIVYSGHPGLVKMTMIAGRILYENGEYKTIDIDEVIKVTKRMMSELL